MQEGKCVKDGVVYLTASGAPPNTRLVWNERVAEVEGTTRTDSYDCTEILDRYRSYWNHYVHVEVEGCELTVDAYSHNTHLGKETPFDTFTVNGCD